MRARTSVKKSIIRGWKGLCQGTCLLASVGIANASIIPNPVLPYGNDSVRTPDGFQCSSAVAPSSYIDAGLYQDDTAKYDNPDKGAYIRVLVPLYSGVDRLDCSTLYEQTLRERERADALKDVKAKVFD